MTPPVPATRPDFFVAVARAVAGAADAGVGDEDGAFGDLHHVTLVPLDASDHVPLNLPFYDRIQSRMRVGSGGRGR
jgi:hypothetical protein